MFEPELPGEEAVSVFERWLMQSLMLYLGLYVTAQVFFHRMPTLLGHIYIWGVIALLGVTLYVTKERRKTRRQEDR